MFNSLIKAIASVILPPFLAIGAWLNPATQLGTELPQVPALFETTLSSPITSSATSLTLASASIRGGATLTGYTCFTIDEGTAQSEYVCGTASSTSVTGLTRGLNPSGGTTTVATLQFSHRRGASVKVTNFPSIALITGILKDQIEVTYTPSKNGSLATKAYVDSLHLGTTTVGATLLDDGTVQLATGLQAGSSTATGTAGTALALSTLISTSTPGTAGIYVPVTLSSGKLSDSFISSSSVTQYAVWKASTTVYTTTGTSTYVKSSSTKFVIVEVVGGGGAGGNGSAGASGGTSGGGGGAGGYAQKLILASDLASSTYVVVGAAASESKFGTSTMVCSAGTAGSGTTPGSGGAATGGDISITGNQGGYGTQASDSGVFPGGDGGSPFALGQGGKGGMGSGVGGTTGIGYGSGGGGGSSWDTSSGGSAGNGSAGRQGVVIITEYL